MRNCRYPVTVNHTTWPRTPSTESRWYSQHLFVKRYFCDYLRDWRTGCTLCYNINQSAALFLTMAIPIRKRTLIKSTGVHNQQKGTEISTRWTSPLLWDTTVHCSVPNGPALHHILSQINPIYTLIHFSHLRPDRPNGLTVKLILVLLITKYCISAPGYRIENPSELKVQYKKINLMRCWPQPFFFRGDSK
jgi:hypothetical protein